MLPFLRQDFLSPLLAFTIFPDFLQRFLPQPMSAFDRARALEHTWNTSWTRSFGSRRFNDDFRNLWKGSDKTRVSKAPALFLNSTNVETGKRFIVSTVDLNEDDRRDSYFAFERSALYHITRMSLSTAVHLSARFTWMSPAGTLMSRPSENGALTWQIVGRTRPDAVIWGRLVDGGYFENSGAATALDVVQAIERSVKRMKSTGELPKSMDVDILVLVVSNDPEPRRTWSVPSASDSTYVQLPPKRPMEPPPNQITKYLKEDPNVVLSKTRIWARQVWLSEMLSPLQALLSTRVARGEAEKTTVDRYLYFTKRDDKSNCTDKLRALLKVEVRLQPDDLDKCRRFQGYKLIHLGDLLERAEKARELGELGIATDDDVTGMESLIHPALGWFLSERSTKIMDILANKMDRENEIIEWLDRYKKFCSACKQQKPQPFRERVREQQMDKLEEDYRNDRISRREYGTRKKQIEAGSIIY